MDLSIIETVWDHLGSYLRWKTQLDDNNWLRSSGTLSCSQDRQAAAGHHKDIMVVDKEQKKNEVKKTTTPGAEGKNLNRCRRSKVVAVVREVSAVLHEKTKKSSV